jgi:hypothetical protein
MPTTLTGLLLFVVLLLPGFAYLVGKERAGTERRTSPFRETVAVVAASVATELAVIVMFQPLWSRSLDVDLMIADFEAYWRDHPALVFFWALGLLAVATILAYLATRPWVRSPQWVVRLAGWLDKTDPHPKWLYPRVVRWLKSMVKYPHPSSVSGWWMLFKHWTDGRPVSLSAQGCADGV